MTEPQLHIEDHGATRVIALDRPDKRNALSAELMAQLIEALDAAGRVGGVRAVVLAGRGPVFRAGGDLREIDAGRPDAAASRADLTRDLHLSLRALPKPIVAAVHGAALGAGAALAIGCDLMIAANDLRFGYPELRRGVTPALAIAALQRRIGEKLAFELIFAGRVLDGAEMLRLGLVNDAVAPETVLRAAIALAQRCAVADPMPVGAAKALFYEVAQTPLTAALALGRDLNIELTAKRRRAQTEDAP